MTRLVCGSVLDSVLLEMLDGNRCTYYHVPSLSWSSIWLSTIETGTSDSRRLLDEVLTTSTNTNSWLYTDVWRMSSFQLSAPPGLCNLYTWWCNHVWLELILHSATIYSAQCIVTNSSIWVGLAIMWCRIDSMLCGAEQGVWDTRVETKRAHRASKTLIIW
jgi:hypothetical protein